MNQIIYWVRSIEPGNKKDRVKMFYKGLCDRHDEGQVGFDIKARPFHLGEGPYTATYGGSDFEDEAGNSWHPKRMKKNPIKLKPIGSNMTEMVLAVPGIRGETKVLFSYETPVAAMNLSPEWHERFGNASIRTEKKWSVTTSKHINKWLAGSRATPVPQEVLDNLETGVMQTNPHKRRSKKKPSPAQLAARKKFIKMVRARAKNRRKAARMKVTQHRRGTATRYKFSRPVSRAQAEAMIAQHKAPRRRRRGVRKNPSEVLLCFVRRNGSRWYLTPDQTLNDSTVYAKRFASEASAMKAASALAPIARKLGMVRAHTERV